MSIQNEAVAPGHVARGDAVARHVAVVRLHLLGPVEAWTAAGENLAPVGRKTRAVLAIVALAAPRPVSRARLMELLWSRRHEDQARASLRQEIFRLQEALQPAGARILDVTRDHLTLRRDLAWVDVDEALRSIKSGAFSLALFKGPLLDELDGTDPALDRWLAAERGTLRDHLRGAGEALLGGHMAPDAVIATAQQLLGIDRAHEGACRALMRAHVQQGEHGLAIRAFERCRAALAGQLGAAPSQETQRLAAEIRAGDKAAPITALIGSLEPKPSCDRVPDGPKIGMLRLQLLGCRDDEAHLPVGLAEEVSGALARFRWMHVVSPSALAGFASRDEAALRSAFGLDFLLDGSVQRAGQRLRVTARLLDLREGNQVIWARRFDLEAGDQFGVQDEVATTMAAQVDMEVLQAEGRRAARRLPAGSSAAGLVLRALPLVTRTHRDDFALAGDLLAQALQLEPDHAPAHAWRACWELLNVAQGWAELPQEAEDAADRHAARAVLLDPHDARALTIAGHVGAVLRRRPREALELHGRALSLNPNLAMAWGFSAIAQTHLGEVDEATRCFACYKRLLPLDLNASLFDAAMVALELSRHDYGAAVALGRRASELSPGSAAGLKPYLSALGHAGSGKDAVDVRGRLLAIEPGFTVREAIRRCLYERQADVDDYVAGLRLAGLPEGEGPPLPGPDHACLA